MPKPAKRLTTLPPYPFATIAQRLNEMKAAGQDVIARPTIDLVRAIGRRDHVIAGEWSNLVDPGDE